MTRRYRYKIHLKKWDDAVASVRAWSTADDPAILFRALTLLDTPPSERQWRLFLCACYRAVWSLLAEDEQSLVEAVEGHADGAALAEDLADAPYRQGALTWVGFGPACLLTLPNALWAAECGASRTRRVGMPGPAQASLMRCVLGNPFHRPIWYCPECGGERPAHGPLPCADCRGRRPRTRAHPAWRRPAVLQVAQAAYEERELPSGHLHSDCLAVLADALEEAGCTDPTILGHIRGPGLHLRGCWALDLLLSKQ